MPPTPSAVLPLVPVKMPAAAFAPAGVPSFLRRHAFAANVSSYRYTRRRNNGATARARWSMNMGGPESSRSTTRSSEQYVDFDDMELAVEDIKLNMHVPMGNAELIPFDGVEDDEFSSSPPHGFALADIPWISNEDAMSGLHSTRLSRPGAYAIRDKNGVLQYVGCCSNVQKRLLQLHHTVGTAKFDACQVYSYTGNEGEEAPEFLEGVVDYWIRVELRNAIPVGNTDSSWEMNSGDKKVLLNTDTPNVNARILDPFSATSYRSAISMRRRFIDGTGRPGKPQLSLLHWKPLGIIFAIALILWLCYVFGINVAVASSKLTL